MSKFTTYALHFRCPYQVLTSILLSHLHHTFSLLHTSWHDRPKNIQSAVLHNMQLLFMQYSAGPNYVHIISSPPGIQIFSVYVSPNFKCKTDVVKWKWRKLHNNKFQFVLSSSHRMTLLSFKCISTALRRRHHGQFSYVTMSWGKHAHASWCWF
jgi:hypothetical protein